MAFAEAAGAEVEFEQFAVTADDTATTHGTAVSVPVLANEHSDRTDDRRALRGCAGRLTQLGRWGTGRFLCRARDVACRPSVSTGGASGPWRRSARRPTGNGSCGTAGSRAGIGSVRGGRCG